MPLFVGILAILIAPLVLLVWAIVGGLRRSRRRAKDEI